MTEDSERIVAIVLAGGRSSRFGRDKLAEPIGGVPMLQRTIDAVRHVTSDIVVVSAPSGTQALPAEVTNVRDDRAYEGPLAGLVTGLRAVDPPADRAIVVGGDMPTLVPAVLARLLETSRTHDAAVLADHDGPRPLPMAVRPATVVGVAEGLLASGERRLRALFDALDIEVISAADWRIDDPTGESLRDVDVPGDLPEAAD